MNGPDIGHVVYFIVAGRHVKVGYSADVWTRLRGMKTSNPLPMILAHTIGYATEEEARRGEIEWRTKLLEVGRHAEGEWVELDLYVWPVRKGPFEVIPVGEFCSGPHATESVLVSESLRRYGLNAPLEMCEFSHV